MASRQHGQSTGEDHNVTIIQEEEAEETDVDDGMVAAMRRNREGDPFPEQAGTVQLDTMRIPNIIDPIPGQQAREPTQKGRKKVTRKAWAGL